MRYTKMNDNNQLEMESVEYSHEDYLKYAQSRRLRFIRGIEKACGSDEALATLDPDRQSNYLAAIRDIEKQVLTLQKLKQEEQSDEARNATIAALILKQATAIDSKRNNTVVTTETILPSADLLPVKQLIPGETDIGDRIENYQEYRARTGLSSNQDPLSLFPGESDE